MPFKLNEWIEKTLRDHPSRCLDEKTLLWLGAEATVGSPQDQISKRIDIAKDEDSSIFYPRHKLFDEGLGHLHEFGITALVASATGACVGT